MEKTQGMAADELAAQMPLDEYIPISEAAKILGGGAGRVKALMDLVMTGGLFSWSHSCPHLGPSRVSHHKIDLEFDLPNLTPETDPGTVLIPSKEVLWGWCVEVEELLQDVDDEGLPPKERVKARLQALKARAFQLKTGMAPDIPAAPVAGWPWGGHHTEALGHLAAAAQRFWVNHDPADSSTAPKNSDVSDWLQTERKVSRNLADSIASILRMDGLPTGPR